jgi:hypothetical protein
MIKRLTVSALTVERKVSVVVVQPSLSAAVA